MQNRSPYLSVCIWVLSFLPFFQCGTNTDTPGAPFLFLIPPSVPQILAVVPITSNVTNDYQLDILNATLNPRPEFILRYFVTNREPQFVGYNLYITTAFPGVIQTIQGEWLEDGVQPSFPHLPFESSTDSARLVTKRIRFLVPPPGVEIFQRYQIYNFTLRSMLTGGLISNPSTPVRACAVGRSVDDLRFFAPVGTGCNTAECSVVGCANPSGCALGTACNPCTLGDPTLGCICPQGSPAGTLGCQYAGP